MRNKLLIGGGLLLIAAALCLTLGNLREGQQAALASRQALESLVNIKQVAQQLPEETDSASAAQESTAAAPDPNREMPVAEVDGVDYVGTLEIPALELTLPVISAWSYSNLKIAPCRYQGSAYQDNLILAAHNYRQHFGRLNELSAGDAVYFTDMEGTRFSYAVAQVEQLPGTAIEEMASGGWALTLFTCTVGGKARVTVRCERTD